MARFRPDSAQGYVEPTDYFSQLIGLDSSPGCAIPYALLRNLRPRMLRFCSSTDFTIRLQPGCCLSGNSEKIPGITSIPSGIRAGIRKSLPCAKQLISEINKIAVESDHQKITLIGHSLGGLLARTVAGDPRCRQKLAAVVTLGAPHQGSKLAAVGFGKLACSLHVASAEMHKIPDFDAPPEAPCLSLFSPVDNMVLPSANLHLDLPGWQEEETAAVSHVFMLYAPDVHKRVLTFLEHVHDSSTI